MIVWTNPGFELTMMSMVLTKPLLYLRLITRLSPTRKYLQWFAFWPLCEPSIYTFPTGANCRQPVTISTPTLFRNYIWIFKQKVDIALSIGVANHHQMASATSVPELYFQAVCDWPQLIFKWSIMAVWLRCLFITWTVTTMPKNHRFQLRVGM